jgi:hypothetical protein
MKIPPLLKIQTANVRNRSQLIYLAHSLLAGATFKSDAIAARAPYPAMPALPGLPYEMRSEWAALYYPAALLKLSPEGNFNPYPAGIWRLRARLPIAYPAIVPQLSHVVADPILGHLIRPIAADTIEPYVRPETGAAGNAYAPTATDRNLEAMLLRLVREYWEIWPDARFKQAPTGQEIAAVAIDEALGNATIPPYLDLEVCLPANSATVGLKNLMDFTTL